MSTSTTLLGLVKPATGEQFSLSTYNNNLDTVDTYAVAQVEKRSKGYMPESKVRTAAANGLTTLVVVEFIASFTFKANRKYRIAWDFSYTMSVLSDIFTGKIQSCSTADSSTLITGLTELIARSLYVTATGAGTHGKIETYYLPGSDTTVQLKFTMERALGTGTFSMEASKSFFTVEDLGAF